METTLSDEFLNVIGKSKGSQFFDDVIGHIEDIVLGEEFQVINILNRNYKIELLTP